jgi:hypothetical protein
LAAVDQEKDEQLQQLSKDLQQRNLFAAVDQEKDEQLQQLSKDRANLQHKISALGALVSSLVKTVSFSYKQRVLRIRKYFFQIRIRGAVILTSGSRRLLNYGSVRIRILLWKFL